MARVDGKGMIVLGEEVHTFVFCLTRFICKAYVPLQKTFKGAIDLCCCNTVCTYFATYPLWTVRVTSILPIGLQTDNVRCAAAI